MFFTSHNAKYDPLPLSEEDLKQMGFTFDESTPSEFEILTALFAKMIDEIKVLQDRVAALEGE